MKYYFFISIPAVASLLISDALAGTMATSAPIKEWRLVGSVSAGPVWVRDSDTQTFYLTPEIEKTYAASKSTQDLAAGELFLGMQKALSSQWLGQLGLAVAAMDTTRLQGEIWDDADPEFNNLSYQYKVRTSRIALKGKLVLDKGYWLMPWVAGSLGVGFNRAYDFTNTPLIFEALPNSNFSNQRTTAFTYTLGAGVQKALNQHWQIGVGYEFADWGKSGLGRAPGQTMNSGLKLNHLYTSGVLFNLTYIA